MAGKIDVFLKLSIIASVIMVSASIGQYYLVYLPQRDAQLDARAEAEKQAAQAKAEAERQRTCS